MKKSFALPLFLFVTFFAQSSLPASAATFYANTWGPEDCSPMCEVAGMSFVTVSTDKSSYSATDSITFTSDTWLSTDAGSRSYAKHASDIGWKTESLGGPLWNTSFSGLEPAPAFGYLLLNGDGSAHGTASQTFSFSALSAGTNFMGMRLCLYTDFTPGKGSSGCDAEDAYFNVGATPTVNLYFSRLMQKTKEVLF